MFSGTAHSGLSPITHSSFHFFQVFSPFFIFDLILILFFPAFYELNLCAVINKISREHLQCDPKLHGN